MNEIWRQLERWFVGHSESADGGDIGFSLEATWPIPTLIVVLIVLGAAALTLLVYWHEGRAVHRLWKFVLAGTRAALVSLVALMLYGWTAQRYRTELAQIVVVLDDSASMGLVDAYDESTLASIQKRLTLASLTDATRLSLAKSLLLDDKAEMLADLSRYYNLRFYTTGESTRPLGDRRADVASAIGKLTASQQASRLGNCLREILDRQRGRSTAAIILLTDGVTTEGISLSDAAQVARRESVPLFFVGLGSERPRRDLRLADLAVDDAAFVGDVLNFEAKLFSEGYAGNAVVALKRRDGTASLAEQAVVLDQSGAAQSIRLTHRTDQAGEFEYLLEVTPLEGEPNVENNQLARKVTVRDETIRVLLVQAYPSYEFRFLKQMLERELNAHQPSDAKRAGFRTVLQEADLEYSQTDKTAERAFPASREELFQYDVLIFGDVNPSLLSVSMMNNIAEFVTTRGGGVIFIAGPKYTPLAYRDTPLAALFPMNLNTLSMPDSKALPSEPFRPRLTLLGAASPMLLLADAPDENEKLWRDELTPLRWMVTATDLRPGVRVLAEHPTRRTARNLPIPVVCLQFIGAGKVIFHATDETHRWRFRVGDLYFARYWLQTTRYLCRANLILGSRAVELSTNRREYRFGDKVNLRLRFLDDRLAPAADEGVSVVVQSDSSERRTAALSRHAIDRGVFEGTLAALPPGEYVAAVAAPAIAESQPTQRFVVTAPPGELARTTMDATVLREAATVSGGKFYTLETANRLIGDLPHGKTARVSPLPPLPLWNAPIVAAIFVALIAMEWIVRRRLGLL